MSFQSLQGQGQKSLKVISGHFSLFHIRHQLRLFQVILEITQGHFRSFWKSFKVILGHFGNHSRSFQVILEITQGHFRSFQVILEITQGHFRSFQKSLKIISSHFSDNYLETTFPKYICNLFKIFYVIYRTYVFHIPL